MCFDLNWEGEGGRKKVLLDPATEHTTVGSFALGRYSGVRQEVSLGTNMPKTL